MSAGKEGINDYGKFWWNDLQPRKLVATRTSIKRMATITRVRKILNEIDKPEAPELI